MTFLQLEELTAGIGVGYHKGEETVSAPPQLRACLLTHSFVSGVLPAILVVPRPAHQRERVFLAQLDARLVERVDIEQLADERRLELHHLEKRPEVLFVDTA